MFGKECGNMSTWTPKFIQHMCVHVNTYIYIYTYLPTNNIYIYIYIYTTHTHIYTCTSHTCMHSYTSHKHLCVSIIIMSWISLTFSRHPSLLFFASCRSSGSHSISAQSVSIVSVCNCFCGVSSASFLW